MKLLLLSVMLTISVHVEAATRCHFGRSYWCQDITTAQDCQMTKFCQDNDWKETNEENFCDICRDAANILKPYMSDKNIEMEIKDALASVCDTLAGSLGDNCKNMVKYFNLGWVIMTQEIESGGICDIMQACSSSSTTHSFKKSLSLDGNMCDKCKTAASVLKPLMNDGNTKMKVKTALENVCVILAEEAANDCYALMSSYDLGWEIMKGIDANGICTMLKVCDVRTPSFKKSISLGDIGSTASDVFEMIVDVSDSITNMIVALVKSVSREIFGIFGPERSTTKGACDMCKIGSFFLKSYVDKQGSKLVWKNAATLACGIISGSTGGSICSTMADDYSNKNNWWLTFGDVMESGDLSCENLDICELSSATSLKKRIKLNARVRDFPNDVRDSLKSALNSIENFFSSTFHKVTGYFEKESMSDDEVCGICKITVSALNSQNMGVQSPLEGVQSPLEGVQSPLEGPLEDVQSPLQDMQSPLEVVQSPLEGVQSPLQGVDNVAYRCDICRRAMDSLNLHIDKGMEPEIRASLEKVCNLFPGRIGLNCSHLINTCFKSGMENVKLDIESGEMCSKLDLCKYSMIRPPTNLLSFGGDGSSNSLQTVLTIIKNFDLVWRLMSPFFGNAFNMFGQQKRSVGNVMVAACQSVPGVTTNECTDYFETYTPKVISLMDKEVDPAVICAEIELCSS